MVSLRWLLLCLMLSPIMMEPTPITTTADIKEDKSNEIEKKIESNDQPNQPPRFFPVALYYNPYVYNRLLPVNNNIQAQPVQQHTQPQQPIPQGNLAGKQYIGYILPSHLVRPHVKPLSNMPLPNMQQQQNQQVQASAPMPVINKTIDQNIAASDNANQHQAPGRTWLRIVPAVPQQRYPQGPSKFLASKGAVVLPANPLVQPQNHATISINPPSPCSNAAHHQQHHHHTTHHQVDSPNTPQVFVVSPNARPHYQQTASSNVIPVSIGNVGNTGPVTFTKNLVIPVQPQPKQQTYLIAPLNPINH